MPSIVAVGCELWNLHVRLEDFDLELRQTAQGPMIIGEISTESSEAAAALRLVH
jgi:hypothetical protein